VTLFLSFRAADPAIQATIFAARDTGVEQFSAPRTLFNGLRGFVIVFPVFEPPDLPADATVQARQDACVG
jgi:sensor domain CHASE-containing protein